MASYSDRGGRLREGSGQRHQTRPRVPEQGPYHGPRGTRTRSSAPRRGSSSGAGYPLRARNINFSSGRARRMNANRRLIILAVIALLVIVLLVVGISSCVRSCSSDQTTGSENPVDSRVAAGVSEDLTRQFATELDRADKLAQIAANADQYENQGLLELALSEPAAIDFVAAYPESSKEAQPYEDEVTQGTVPELYCWDERWGAVDYADAPLALTGSGPTALAMARMGLLGNAEQTPATVAQAVSDAGMAGGDSGMSADFLGDQLSALGLSSSSYASNADNLLQVLDTGTYLLLEVSAGTLTDSAHWVLVTAENEDGSVTVLDPTSPDVSSHTWDAATVASAATNIYALTAADAASGGDAATE